MEVVELRYQDDEVLAFLADFFLGWMGELGGSRGVVLFVRRDNILDEICSLLRLAACWTIKDHRHTKFDTNNFVEGRNEGGVEYNK